MTADELDPADEAFLDELLDLAVRCRATGEELDLEALLAGRAHLRDRGLQVIELGREVAVGTQPTPPGRPSSVPGFTLLEELGRGGMGIVYRARDERLGREVALKILAPSLLASAHSRERFEVEAMALTRLRHPNVITVHDVLAHDDVCAYVMELVDGSTLAKAVAERDPRLGITEIAQIGLSMARALAAVHDAGLVHRDVKPGNVLLRRDGTATLSDFGLVRDVDHSMHTAAGEFVGTAAYAAPEQLRGEHDKVGSWTDVYGLGVTLYVALTGCPPFGSTTVEILRRIESGGASPIRKSNPRVPRDLATIVAKAMDPDPQRRYLTAADLAEDLERFLRHEPVRARGAGTLLRLRRFAHRRPALATAAAIVLLLLVGGPPALYVHDLGAIERERDLRVAAEGAEAKAKNELDVSRHVLDFVRRVFQRGNASESLGRTDMTVRAALDEVAADLLDASNQYKPEVEYAIRMVIVESYISIGLMESAQPHLTAAESARRAAFREDGAEAASTVFNLGRIYREMGRLEDAERCLREAVRIRRTLIDGRPESMALAAQSLSSLGIVLRRQAKLAAAEEAYLEALELYRRSVGDRSDNVALVRLSLATLQVDQGRLAEAEENVREALAKLTAYHEDFNEGRPHLDISHATFVLGKVLLATHRPEEGERAMREALTMTRSLVGLTHHMSADQAFQLAVHLRQTNELGEAEALLRASFEAFDALSAFDNPKMIWAEAELASLLLASERESEAEALLTRGLGRAHHDGAKQPRLRQLGLSKTRARRFVEAEADLSQAWALLAGYPSAGDRSATVTALVELFEAWNAAEPDDARAACAAEWRAVHEAAAQAPASVTGAASQDARR